MGLEEAPGVRRLARGDLCGRARDHYLAAGVPPVPIEVPEPNGFVRWSPTDTRYYVVQLTPMSRNRSMLTLADVSKSYGPRTLFSDVSLFVARTDRFGLVGPNDLIGDLLVCLQVGQRHRGAGAPAATRPRRGRGSVRAVGRAGRRAIARR